MLALTGLPKRIKSMKVLLISGVTVTKSGLQVEKWLERTLETISHCEIWLGILFEREDTKTPKLNKLENDFMSYLLRVQERGLNVIPHALEVRDNHHFIDLV